MAKKGSLQHIHIEPADNGYTVRAHHREPEGDGKAMPTMVRDEKPHLALTKEDASAHVGKLLAEHEGVGSGPSDSAPPDDKKKHPAYGAFGRGR